MKSEIQSGNFMPWSRRVDSCVDRESRRDIQYSGDAIVPFKGRFTGQSKMSFPCYQCYNQRSD